MQSLEKTLSDPRFGYAFVGSLLFATALFGVPDLAFASVADDINGWLCGLLRDTCNWIFNSQVDMLKSIGTDGVLSASFTQMLGSAGSVTMYDVVHGVWEVAILPVGCGVLSFVFTIQLIKISQRMDGNAAMPGVKEVVFLLVFFAVFLFLVQNSFSIMQAIYEVTKLAIDRVAGLFGTGSQIDLTTVSITTTDGDVAALLAMLVVALVSWLVVIVAYVVALVVTWARAIQIYIMAAFSPIPLSHGARRDQADGSRIPEELRRRVPRRHHHPRAARQLPDSLGRPQRGERWGAGCRLDSRRPLVRAPIPGHVRPAHPLAREERRLGPGHHGRLGNGEGGAMGP